MDIVLFMKAEFIESYNFFDKDAYELSNFLFPLLGLNPNKHPSTN
jgi:hypothetical protein